MCTTTTINYKLVESPDVHWVMVSPWNCYHADQVVCAFDAGKHLFCQKPLATTPEDCKRSIFRRFKFLQTRKRVSHK